MVNNQRLGTIRMSDARHGPAGGRGRQAALAEKLGIELKQLKQAVSQLTRPRAPSRRRFSFCSSWPTPSPGLCYQEFQLRQRINELTAVYNVTMMLADARDLEKVLQRTVRVVCEVMETKASSLRLIDDERDELVIKAVHNLSAEYIDKGPIRLSQADIDQHGPDSKGYEYVRNMATDPRVQYPQEAKREGIVSMLSVGMRYKGKADRRAARLHRAGTDLHAASDRSAEGGGRPGGRGDRKRAARAAKRCSHRRWSGRSRWRRRCSTG